MKTMGVSSDSRIRWLMAGCLALLASSVAFSQVIDSQLTDEEIARWLPRLRDEAAAFTRQVSEGREATTATASTSEEHEALLADMSSGKIDISTWMRSQTKYALVPPGAVYCADCSKALLYETGGPIAVHTLRRQSQHHDLLRRAGSGDESARDEFYTRRGDEEARERTATELALQDLVAGIKKFYFDQGFSEAKVIDRPVIVWFLQSPDERVAVRIWEVNPYCGLLPRNIIASCAELPTGLMIENELRLEPVIIPGVAPEEPGAADEKGGDGKTPSAGGKEATDYERVKAAILLAYTDSANPEALEVEIPRDAPAEAKAALASYAAELAPRKENVSVYKRHEAELAPILKAFFQLPE